MSQRDSFAGGFFLGALVGGAVGGVLGAVVATRSRQINESDEERSLLSSGRGEKIDTEEGMEKARRRLEDKIAQLNNAIDDVREQLGPTNGSTSEQEML
jgi:nitroimidazol reductase NimA-like FMN-containing flavoprotein (pyridoxamine 5'-phosphate oxidase superfamily)